MDLAVDKVPLPSMVIPPPTAEMLVARWSHRTAWTQVEQTTLDARDRTPATPPTSPIWPERHEFQQGLAPENYRGQATINL